MNLNYNPNAGMRNRKWENSQGGSRRPQRVSDMNAMGPTAPMPGPSTYMPQPAPGPTMLDPNMYGAAAAAPPVNNYGFNGVQSQLPPQQQPQQQPNYSYPPQPQGPAAPPAYGFNAPPQQGAAPAPPGQYPAQFAMFQQPIVQDMAMQYGQKLADQGKQLVENQFEKWVPVSKLKYYFAVDNAYVGRKLRLLFFPYIHKDWSLKYDQEHPVQPRYDINAPDLYLPTMGFITYVIVAGLLLGMQKRFSPEQLGIQASSAMAYSVLELVIYSIALYVMNIKTSLKTLDLLAFIGYKYLNIVASLMLSTLFFRSGYYMALAYTSFAFGFFLLRTLRTKLLHDNTPAAPSGAINYDPYGNPQQFDYSGGKKRKLYFLFMVIIGQALFSFWLSKHLYLVETENLAMPTTI
ncbi:protein YIF1B-A isoform X1 [Drosophila willistoni]|uniref:protein YIF1B-A isoform X1 n=1 Tax=Drosophila willistoni TaxID=7260 RepID=UPI000C26CF2E|nr:protein YIF1B-A isoform X1 [Drosophila willistoni]XP_046866387.1 protein YIF1B-A isoform X1 [Drosophila willistoni]